MRLREVREGAGVSASALSEAADVARDAVRKVEVGDIENPGIEFLVAVAELLGVSLDWLAYGRGSPPGPQELELAAVRVHNAAIARKRNIDEPIPFIPTTKTGT